MILPDSLWFSCFEKLVVVLFLENFRNTFRYIWKENSEWIETCRLARAYQHTHTHVFSLSDDQYQKYTNIFTSITAESSVKFLEKHWIFMSPVAHPPTRLLTISKLFMNLFICYYNVATIFPLALTPSTLTCLVVRCQNRSVNSKVWRAMWMCACVLLFALKDVQVRVLPNFPG